MRREIVRLFYCSYADRVAHIAVEVVNLHRLAIVNGFLGKEIGLQLQIKTVCDKTLAGGSHQHRHHTILFFANEAVYSPAIELHQSHLFETGGGVGHPEFYANSYCKIAMFSASSNLQIVSRERFSSPFNNLEMY